MFLKRFFGASAPKQAVKPASPAPQAPITPGKPRPAAQTTVAPPITARPSQAAQPQSGPTREQLAGRIRQLVGERDHHHSFAKRVQLENEDLHKEIARLLEENGHLWDQVRDAIERGQGPLGAARQPADDEGIVPCPFCNAAPKWWGPSSTVLHCLCKVAPEVDGGTRDATIRLWNRRWHDL